MAELPTHTSDYLHRSIDQLRSMNERGVLSSLSHLTTADLRTAQLVHDYKPFNINEFRQNVERLDYSIKNGLVGVGLDRSGAVNLQQHQQQLVVEQQQQQAHEQQQQQQQQQQQAHEQQQQQHHHQQHLQQQQQQQQAQQHVVKQSYSAPNSPPTPTMSDVQEQKYDPNTGDHKHRIHHQQTASPEGREAKPYKCTQCSKTFANSSYLSQHTRIHLGIKPYRCEICQRKFTQLSHLQQHIRTHTGDKPYKCRHAGCPKAFSQLSNLQSHSRCHQTDKPFKCNSCYKCFTDEMTLMEHIPKHKDSKHLKTHICNLCGKSYTQETYLQKHLQKHAEKVEKQQRNAANTNNAAQNVGLGLNLQRQVVMNAAAVAADTPYWAKVGADSAVNAATLAEAIQQQQQQQQQQHQQAAQNGYNFALQQQQQQQQEVLQHHHRVINGGGGGNSGGGSGGGDSAGSGSTPIHSQSPNDEGEDLVMRQTPQHHLQQQQQASAVIGGNSPAANYDVKTTSAFTPINSAPPHLNALAQQRPPAAAYQLYQQNAAAAAAAFPTQLISLHQIRNYAHQPGAAAAAGLLASDHLLGLSVAAGGAGKDKTQ